MSREMFEKRKYEFIETIIREGRLPRVWEFRFSDGEDQRLWFNTISKLKAYDGFMNEINALLSKYNIKVLSDKEKEIEFLDCIKIVNRVPQKGEYYFSDNDEMYMWYMNYIIKHREFERLVRDSLREYQDFDLATVWPLVKNEFLTIIKGLKRIPNYGEVILQNDIDARTIYDKLETFDPEFVEKLLLHLQTYNSKGLGIDDRREEMIKTVSKLGYIPYLQECRFSDGTDMFTWYNKYKDLLPNFRDEINSLISRKPDNKKVNIYLIPNFRKAGGKFYTICTNVGERLDLSQINSFEDALKLDPDIIKRGGVILKQDEEIETVSFKKGKSK